MIRRAVGDGVLVVQGAQHRAQRRVMNPAFGPAQVRELSGIFLDKANEVRVTLVAPPSF
jgi:cytochrome P450